jgi:signal transduction histidine kinase
MSAETHPAETAQELETIQKRLQGLISELRTYAGELRPPTLSKFGLEGTIRSHMETFQEKHPEPHIVLDLHQNSEILSETIGVALFRIYQQALNNIIKHAQASEASVQMEEDQDQVRLIIQDNGQGFVVPEDWINLARHGHLGLLGMRERAEAVGGKFEVTSVPGKGTQIIVTIPLDPLGGERRTHLI